MIDIRPLTLGAVVLFVPLIMGLFQNCAKYQASKGGIDPAAYSSSENSSQPLPQSGPRDKCANALFEVYRGGFHPFLSKNCVACHKVGGIGKGNHGDPDIEKSYAAFNAVGVELISAYAINSAHKAPYTGPVNVPAISTLKPVWVAAVQNARSCKVESPGAPGPTDDPTGEANRFLTDVQSLSLAPDGTRLTWPLDTKLLQDGKSVSFPGAKITFDVKTYLSVTGETGYIFSQPTLMSGSKVLKIYDIRFVVNGENAFTATTYTYVEELLGANQSKVLSVVPLILPMVVAPTDKIALSIGNLASP